MSDIREQARAARVGGSRVANPLHIAGEKWYTASLMTNGLWFVVNHQGRAINQGTAVHRRVVATLPADGR